MRAVLLLALIAGLLAACSQRVDHQRAIERALAERDSSALSRCIQSMLSTGYFDELTGMLIHRAEASGAERWIVEALGDVLSRELVNSLVTRAGASLNINAQRAALEVTWRERAVEIVRGPAPGASAYSVVVLELAVARLGDEAPIAQSSGAHGPSTYAAMSSDLLLLLLAPVFVDEKTVQLPGRTGADVSLWSAWLDQRRARLRWDGAIRGYVLGPAR